MSVGLLSTSAPTLGTLQVLGRLGPWGNQLMCEKCFEAEKQEVLSIISRFSMSFQQLLKLMINTTYLKKKKKKEKHRGKENSEIQPQVSTRKTVDAIRHHAAVVINSRCTEWAYEQIPKRLMLTNTQTSFKLLFKIAGSSQQPRVSLKRGALKGT